MTRLAPASTLAINPDPVRLPQAERNDTWVRVDPFYMAVVFEDNFEDDITFTIREGFQELPQVIEELRVNNIVYVKLIPDTDLEPWNLKVLNKRNTTERIANYQEGITDIAYFRFIKIEGHYSKKVADCTI
jgi:hypothetical protein